jgi:predicted phosphoadenosine phosphosulfate sulfurtransferase
VKKDAKRYTTTDVYTATLERLQFIFSEFDNVVIAFSGGKDSGVLLNIALQYAKDHNLLHKLAVYHIDYEAQYTTTTEYVGRTFTKTIPKEVGKYWICLPLAAQCAVSQFQDHWLPWEKAKKDMWVREIPCYDFVVNEVNCPFKFAQGEQDYDVQLEYVKWYHKKMGGKTAVLVGIRADESLSRLGTITSNARKYLYEGIRYSREVEPDLYNFYPLYDWTTQDIWIANAKNGWDYNKLYDLFYQAGLSIHQMRVASPFNDCAVNSLKLYRVVEPNMWAKMVGRVNGVNFSGIYGGTTAMGWKSIVLPAGHTWKSYMEFLLSTLPEDIRKSYIKKLDVSKRSWKTGGAVEPDTIKELEEEGAPIIRTGKTNNRGYKNKEVVQFNDYLDDTNVSDFRRIPTYKRMCICIMKNDHLCKYMGFAQTKRELEKRKNAIEKYKNY